VPNKLRGPAGCVAVRSTPTAVIPEPASAGLFGVGMLMLAARRNRKND